mgnify:CR=1 FL=1
MKISIVGTGYVGLVTGACFANMGYDVCCSDISTEKVEILKTGAIPFFEPGLEDMVKRTISSNNLFFTSDNNTSLNFADIIFVCVGTPQDKVGKPNLTYLEEYFLELIKSLKLNDDFMSDPDAKKHIFIKSTIPPGTIKYLNSIFKKDNLETKILLSSNPEFLKEGSAVQDFMKPDRVVVGSNHQESINIAIELYRSILWKSDRMIVTSPESSEIIKYAANSFLAMKISYINQISRLSDVMGGDIHEIRKGIGMDERINPHFLYAGLGYGGSCFPKDVNGLEFVMQSNNLSSELISATNSVNNSQVHYFLQKILALFSPEELKEKELAFWGLAFKPNTDDIRESVAIKLITLLAPMVKKIYAYEPIASKNASKELNELNNIHFSNSALEALDRSNALIIATEYSQFWNVSPDHFLKLKDRVIFDGRNILDKEKLENIGIKYIGIGR